MPTLQQQTSPHGGNAATGLVFVGIVLTVLFAGGIGAVVATHPGQPATSQAPGDDQGAPGRGGQSSAAPSAGREASASLAQLVGLRDDALARRDAAMLGRVYASGCVNRRYDQATIAQLVRAHQRWVGLRSTVRVLRASQTGALQWTLVAAVSRAPARLVTEAGRQVKAVGAQRQVLRFTMLRLPDGQQWALLGIASAGATG
ncbi:MAG TPA: hypothetical protein VF486_03465 [Actinomycetes bacterium]